MGRRSSGLAPFDPRALDEYRRYMALPGSAHGICQDCRVSAGIDLAHDRADRAAGRRLAMRLLALWGGQGVVGRCFDPLREWRQVAPTCAVLRCLAATIPEEAPDALLDWAWPFFGGRTGRAMTRRRPLLPAHPGRRRHACESGAPRPSFILVARIVGGPGRLHLDGVRLRPLVQDG